MNELIVTYFWNNWNSVTISEKSHWGGGDLRFRFEQKNLQGDPIAFEFTVSRQRSNYTIRAIRKILVGEAPEGESMKFANVKRISDEFWRQLMLNIWEHWVSVAGIDPKKKAEIHVDIWTHTILKQTFSMVARAMMKDNEENPLTDISTEQGASVYS